MIQFILLLLFLPHFASASGKIIDADIAPAGTANIARNKMASGVNYAWCVNNGSGVLSDTAVTASRAVVSDANGAPLASATTATELGFVSGVTSSIQTQLNSKQATLTIGNLTDAGTDGITVTSGTGAVIGSGTSFAQHVADSTHNGYLLNTDWSSFNGRQVTLVPGHDIWVDRNGSDSNNGSIAAPVQTVGYALTLISSPSSTNNWTIHLLSGRHDQETGDLLLPPYTWIVGNGGPDVGSYLRLPAGKAIKVSSAWTVNARGGMQSVYLGGGTSVNLDFVGVGGSAGSTFVLDDVVVSGSVTHTGRGVNGGDFITFLDSTVFGAASFTGSEVQSTNTIWYGTYTAATGTSVNCDMTLNGGSIAGNFALTQSGSPTASITTSGTAYYGTFTTTGTVALTADGNLPIGYSLSGGTTRVNSANAASLGYVPATSANWPVVPTLVNQGLDYLAGIVKTPGNLTDAGTDGITVTSGTGAVFGTGTSLAQHVADSTHNGYLLNTDWNTFNSKGSGTVTAVSVASANGFAGSSSGGSTPALTLSTTITGILKGNGTAISAATSGTDYAPATSGSSILYGNGAGGFSNVTVGSGLTFSGGTLSASGGGGGSSFAGNFACGTGSADANTTLLYNFDTSPVVDYSPSANTVTVNGSPTLSNGQVKFGAQSYFQNATSTSYQATGPGALGSGSFTIDFWAYTSAWTNSDGIANTADVASGNVWYIGVRTGAPLGPYFYYGGALGSLLNCGAPTANAWHHFAIVRNGTALACYLDGVSQGTGTDSTNYTQSQVRVGFSSSQSGSFHGYIDEFRISNIARWTTNFTPPASAYTITNTINSNPSSWLSSVNGGSGAGACTVNFTTPFGSAPNCVCSAQASSGPATCQLSGASTTSAVSLLNYAGSTATNETVSLFCQ